MTRADRHSTYVGWNELRVDADGRIDEIEVRLQVPDLDDETLAEMNRQLPFDLFVSREVPPGPGPRWVVVRGTFGIVCGPLQTGQTTEFEYSVPPDAQRSRGIQPKQVQADLDALTAALDVLVRHGLDSQQVQAGITRCEGMLVEQRVMSVRAPAVEPEW